MYFLIGDDGTIGDAKFEGSGCAISVASASLLTDSIIGKSTNFASRFFSAVVALLSGKASEEIDSDIDLGKLQALEGVKEFPSRVKCATLAWHALNSALNNDRSPATTE
jgi:nitrogen fixation NifU-like protein